MTRRVVLVLVAVMLLVMIPIASMSTTQNTSPAPAAQGSVANCSQVRINPKQVRITCTVAGVVSLNTVVNLPVVEVTLPGDTVTVRIPGQEQTIRVPGPTVTQRVEVPGATQTIEVPGETRTIEQSPQGRPERSQAPAPPTVTVTESPDITEGGQGGTTPATIEPDDDGGVTLPEVDLSTGQAIGLGVLGVLGLVFIVLLGMYAGYYMGYKDSDKAEAKFLTSLLRKKE